MATKSELIQSLNTAFSGPQLSVLQQVLEYLTTADVDVSRLDGTVDAANLPVATDSALGIASFSTGLTVTDGVVTVDA